MVLRGGRTPTARAIPEASRPPHARPIGPLPGPSLPGTKTRRPAPPLLRLAARGRSNERLQACPLGLWSAPIDASLRRPRPTTAAAQHFVGVARARLRPTKAGPGASAPLPGVILARERPRPDALPRRAMATPGASRCLRQWRFFRPQQAAAMACPLATGDNATACGWALTLATSPSSSAAPPPFAADAPFGAPAAAALEPPRHANGRGARLPAHGRAHVARLGAASPWDKRSGPWLKPRPAL